MPPRRLSTENLTEAEKAVRARIGDQPFDFAAMSVIANIYRTATAFRNHVERELLSSYGVSWSGFTTLFVLWVWGPSDANQLAEDVGVSNPTLTGLIATLSGKGLVERLTPHRDRRKTVVSLTPEGLDLIEALFPRFHAYEVRATEGIAYEDQKRVAESLRTVLRQLGRSTTERPAGSGGRAVEDHHGLEVAVEVQGVVAPLAAYAGEAAAPEGSGQVPHQKGVDPDEPGPEG